MKIENELIYLDPHPFERIENYLACVKELQLKLDECGKDFLKKDGQLIELVLMNLKTPYDFYAPHFATIGDHIRKMMCALYEVTSLDWY